MDGVLQMFKEGGAVMYPLLALDVLLFPLSVPFLAVAIASRWVPQARVPALVLAGLQLVGGVLVGLVGVGGWLRGRQVVEEALAVVDPSMVEQIREVGYAEAAQPLKFGLVSALFVILPAVLSLVLAGGASGSTPTDEG